MRLPAPLSRRDANSCKNDFGHVLVVAGSPATVREHVERFEAESGTDYFVGKFALGDLSHRELMRSIDLFATEVMAH